MKQWTFEELKEIRFEMNKYVRKDDFESVKKLHELGRVFQEVTANKDNFFIYSFANFKKVDVTFDREPDFTSNSWSKYWYTKEGVYRLSTHWGNKIKTCSWFLDEEEGWWLKGAMGFCKWEDFIAKGDLGFYYNEELEKIEITYEGYDFTMIWYNN